MDFTRGRAWVILAIAIGDLHVRREDPIAHVPNEQAFSMMTLER